MRSRLGRVFGVRKFILAPILSLFVCFAHTNFLLLARARMQVDAVAPHLVNSIAQDLVTRCATEVEP